MIRKDNGLSICRQCKLLGINRSSLYYEPAEPEEACLMLPNVLLQILLWVLYLTLYVWPEKENEPVLV